MISGATGLSWSIESTDALLFLRQEGCLFLLMLKRGVRIGMKSILEACFLVNFHAYKLVDHILLLLEYLMLFGL